MKKKEMLKKEHIMFIVISVLLVMFQVGVYMKLCRTPDIFDVNMIMLYVALIFPFVIDRTKNIQMKYILLSVYLIYFAIVVGSFVEAMANPNVNCTGTIYFGLDELMNHSEIVNSTV